MNHHSSSGNICGIKLGIAEVLFASVSSESFSSVYSAPGVSTFSIWLCASSFLIELSLNWEKAWSNKSPYGSNYFVPFSKSWTSCSLNLFWHNGGQPDRNCFSSLKGKNKSITWWVNFSGDRKLFGMWYWRIRLTFRQCIVFPEIINYFFEELEHSSWLFSIKLWSNSSGWYSPVLLDLFLSV